MTVDPDRCQTERWCQEPRDHPGEHRRYLAELVGRGNATLALTLETRGGKRLPVLSIGNSTVAELALTWAQLDQLAAALDRAYQTYAFC